VASEPARNPGRFISLSRANSTARRRNSGSFGPGIQDSSPGTQIVPGSVSGSAGTGQARSPGTAPIERPSSPRGSAGLARRRAVAASPTSSAMPRGCNRGPWLTMKRPHFTHLLSRLRCADLELWPVPPLPARPTPDQLELRSLPAHSIISTRLAPVGACPTNPYLNVLGSGALTETSTSPEPRNNAAVVPFACPKCLNKPGFSWTTPEWLGLRKCTLMDEHGGPWGSFQAGHAGSIPVTRSIV
jgi:hypothetical protein